MATSNADIAVEALRAIVARYEEDFDNPFLVDQLGRVDARIEHADNTRAIVQIAFLARRALNKIDGVGAYLRQVEQQCVGTYCHGQREGS